jgi:hypothetical protein
MINGQIVVDGYESYDFYMGEVIRLTAAPENLALINLKVNF